MKMQPPKLLTDLYRDLRDRRLLLPAAALLVALVAVPVLLSSSPPPPAAPAATSVEPTAASPAVLAEQVGIRNYRKRLEALKRKNPFDQKFAAPDLGSVEVTEAVGGALGGTAERPDLDDPIGTAPTETASPAGGASSAPSPSASEAGSKSDAKPPKLITKLISRRIDVKVGPVGAAKKIKNVRALDFLPSGKVPVTAFLGVNEGGKRAAFLVSSDIVSSRGDGRCVPPSPAPCYFLVLKVGEQRQLVFQPEGEEEPTTYKLKLLRVRDAVVKSFDR